MKKPNNKSKPLYMGFRFWLFRLLYKTITWIHSSLATRGESSDPKVFLPFLRRLDQIKVDRGVRGLLTFVKGTRTAFLGYLSNNPSKVSGVKCTSDGIPKALGDLIPLVRGSDSPRYFLPFLSTILWSTRALNIRKLPNYNTISQPASVQVPSEIGKNSKAFWQALGIKPFTKVPKSLAWKKYRMTSKSSPNGQALSSSLQDLYCLPTRLVDNIMILGGMKLRHFISVLKTDTVQRLLTKVFSLPSGRDFRKIIHFPDKEDKVRVVALLDYWSQECLRPLHNWLFRILRKIPQDCTFNQRSFIDKMKNCDWYYSIDLTAATDRFPISTIQNVLRGVLPNNYVKAWSDIMVGYPFKVAGREDISYAVRNPMRAYSSWAAFAVSNHYIIWSICQELNINWHKLQYCLLGDDIVIRNKEVRERYIEVLESLGVEVSGVKTHKSQYFYEFAKRLIYKNREISPFPLSSVKESSKRYYLMMNLIREESKKSWVFREPVSDAVGTFYQEVKHYRSKRSKDLASRAEISDKITQVIRGLLPANELLSHLIRQFDPHPPVYEESQAKAFLSQFILAAFRESLTPNPSSTRPLLGTKSTKWLEDLTREEEFYSLLSAPGLGVEMIPILQVYRQVEEKFISAQKRVLDWDSTKGDWPLIHRSIAFPLYDDVFVVKSKDILLLSSSTLGRKLTRWLKKRYTVSTIKG